MTTITITLTATSPDTNWGDVLTAVETCTPTNRDLLVNGEWSGDVDAFSDGFKVRVAVSDGSEKVTETGTLDTLEALIEALDEVRDIYTRLELQKGVLADATKAGDEEQAAFSQERIGRHEVNLEKAQQRLMDAQEAHRKSKKA
jgi:soluble cytochrome b562